MIEKVFSPILNEQKDVNKASFWKECYHSDEVTETMLKNGKQWYIYHVKFNGLKPIQITKIEKI